MIDVYVGEIGRKFGTRLNEHKKDCEARAKTSYTRANRKLSESTWENSATTDHQKIENHQIDWEGASIVEREQD